MKDKIQLEKAIDIFTNYLKEHQQRKTPERFAILRQIAEIEGHFNADSLYDMMQEKHRVSLATIYNTLELLVATHLIIKHQFGRQESQYEKTFGSKQHHHLVCTHCGNVKEFSDRQMRVAIQSKRFPRFFPTHYSLYIYGICQKCKNTDKPE